MSISSLAQTSLTFAQIGLLLMFTVWGVGLIVMLLKKCGLNIQLSDPVKLVGGGTLVLGALCLVIALVLIVWTGVWWCLNFFQIELTPGGLAIFFVIFGPSPILVTMFGGLLAKMMGGEVDASGAKNCNFLGFNFDSVIYNTFMFHYMAIFTLGVSFLGLVVCGIWAVS